MESLSQTLSAGISVEIVVWPQDEALRRSLARAGVPRLLVVAEGHVPPESVAFDEDWIREPFDAADLNARVRRIEQSVVGQSQQDAWLDDERVLHRGTRTAVLTASEAVVADVLLANEGQVVTRESLEGLLWPEEGPPSERAVDAIMYRLRRRCTDLGLMIRNARGEGFVLIAAAAAAAAAAVV